MELDSREIVVNREQARIRAEIESKRADMKQHADKLIQGFEKLEERHAKRAIWELFQNAIDLSENCMIIIELKNESIIFRHNGKPFTSNTLSCLIKQVSSKTGESKDDEVGQYGTGFISTHSFGKNILVTGSLQEGEYYIPLENFEIDRIAPNVDQFIDKLLKQQNHVFELIEQGELRAEVNPYTSFAYQTISDLEKQNAIAAVESLIVILPYVMTINKKLMEVKVSDKNCSETIYRKGITYKENELRVTEIHINQDIKKIYTLFSEQEELIIILPLSEKNESILFDKNLSKLFLYYPLIGTENFGFNFIIHSKLFAPTEPRDGIHLKSKNEQVQEKETNNRYLIDKASKMIFDYMEKYSMELENPIFLASIYFNSSHSNIHLSKYFSELKNTWVEKFKAFTLVETDQDRLKAADVKFFADELLIDLDYFDSVYSIAKLFWKNIPKKNIASEWTKTVVCWENIDTSYIKVFDIVKKIEEAGKLDFFPDPKELLTFYKFLIKYSHSEVFTQHRILPNIKNDFRLQSQLNSTLNIDAILIKVADIIIPDIPKRYIKPEFELSLGFESYDRKQFSKDINSQIAELNKSILENSLLQKNILLALIEYCKIFPSADSTSTRRQLVKIVCEYYEIDSTLVSLPSIINQEIEWLTPMKCLLRNFIWELNTKDISWVESNSKLISNLLEIIYAYYEFEDMVQTLPIFPNQLFSFCKQSELKIDGEIPDELKDIYDKIVKPQKKIRSTLILSSFSKYLKNGETKLPKSIGDSIDKVFQDAKPYTEINDHPYKKEILFIIKKISDENKWATYFPFIEDKKAIIMMAKISDPDIKNDLFSIIGLDKNKIALLGDLSRQLDIERIIIIGKAAIEEDKRNKADFQFKYSIGTHIEKLIREKLGVDLGNFNITVRDEQGGQDIVVEYNNSIVYYIEVKSRWDVRNSITMSPLQMKNSICNKDKYSLCCVDMSNYKIDDNERYSVSDIKEILNRIQVLNDIGSRIEPILSGILSVRDFESEISIVGDYRGTIPQIIVKNGQTFDNFVNHLIKIIKPN